MNNDTCSENFYHPNESDSLLAPPMRVKKDFLDQIRAISPIINHCHVCKVWILCGTLTSIEHLLKVA
jgi:hypothetical protein